ncbi:DUF1937 family protein [Mesorhizobium sp. BR1-1-16]|uniref:DUF1937 family protein n=1 Tax=Mesorhizobium sp. BR1-1-16 TaxID=2876653 RepID=UPI001CCD2304|nr:DUF1937 family protein [Mesorhizobium sp. BR1-1-16]MBZ9939114.1 DUF1937 family protein [Mesorhizobium sp. BR1-1-16]
MSNAAEAGMGITLQDIAGKPGIAFLSTPYTRYEAGLDPAARVAGQAAAALIGMGIHVYSPIAHGHAIAKAGRLDPTDAEMWMRNDRAIFAMSAWLVVVRIRGYDRSLGVGSEIAAALEMGKPIIYVSPAEIGLDKALGP